ncbi:MAG: hypothetical protein HYX28_05810 [Candidatus Koribacter versatilis]|uniref:Uncharacterized protein n=1 Tax=Candidatus Korobacter versatilis TaxID=658062 RepID=A0A932A884_9BACT|nr:hypothetical protein [Candidatus Koribacter versatilis]
MRKLLIAAVLLAAAASASAQGRHTFGPPACAQCITTSNPTPGVPAGATSFTAFNPPPSMGFTAFNPPPSYGVFSPSFRSNGGNISVGTGRHGRGQHRGNFYPPIGYGYGYGYAYPGYGPVYDAQPEPAPVADAPSGNAMDREMLSLAAARGDRAMERDDNARVPADQRNDPRYGEHYLDAREPGSAANSAPAPGKEAVPREEEGPSLILVLLDGTRLELANYAIVGKTVFDLSRSHRGKKIQLAELDLPATQKANDALGLDFKLPSR